MGQKLGSNSLEGWNEVAVWQEFKPPFISGEIWILILYENTETPCILFSLTKI